MADRQRNSLRSGAASCQMRSVLSQKGLAVNQKSFSRVSFHLTSRKPLRVASGNPLLLSDRLRKSCMKLGGCMTGWHIGQLDGLATPAICRFVEHQRSRSTVVWPRQGISRRGADERMDAFHFCVASNALARARRGLEKRRIAECISSLAKTAHENLDIRDAQRAARLTIPPQPSISFSKYSLAIIERHTRTPTFHQFCHRTLLPKV